MSDIFAICGTGVCALFAVLTVREVRKDWIPYLLLAASLLLCALTLPGVSETASFIRELDALVDSDGANAGLTGVILRALGVTWLTAAAAELCRSSGETSLASWIEMAGRVELVVLSIPLLRRLMAVAGIGG